MTAQRTLPASRARVKATVLDAPGLRRSLTRIAHEILERNRGAEGLILVGVISKGDILAHRLSGLLETLEGNPVPVGEIDTSGHRDDRVPIRPPVSRVPDLAGRTVVIVDDVLHHGRTARAALEALLEFGRPRAVQLAVLVDRGHRELPIRADYVGKNVPTSEDEHVEVLLAETDGTDGAVILGV
ncbi:MAG: bifunctional pyr operon transcriptional regulator/uracil phosphoribosyltransferase PyrR [Candidatus Dormibacteraeota bacterium]|nr:bifunctional pyr operon transcriptional regulator/uracil phosphoribosyltransferase PyrR [Candidatus Dormibacteraeota bacterium]